MALRPPASPDDLGPTMHRITLRFPPELERPFRVDYFQKSVRQVRIGQVVGAGVFAMFAVIDPMFIPQVMPEVWAMRLLVVLCFALTFLATFLPGFQRWMQPAVAGMVVIAGLGLDFVLAVAPAPQREIYFGGIMLIVLAGYTYMKVRFVPAVIAAGLLWVSYDVVDILVRDTPLPLLLTANLYLIATNVLGMFAGYNMERYTRLDFLQRRRIEDEEAQLSRVLLNVLPPSIAERLMHESGSIAERFATVTILFADIVHFTELSGRVSAEELVALLNEVFSAFDELVEKHGLEKIKTIGDAYMAVAGVPTVRDDATESVADFALDILDALKRLNVGRAEPLRLRVGMHTGPVVAGVIGTKRFAYDLWGDTVNTASRMESHGLPDTIQVTRATYERLR